MFLKNVRYIAAWSEEVPVTGIFKRKLLGGDVVFLMMPTSMKVHRVSKKSRNRGF